LVDPLVGPLVGPLVNPLNCTTCIIDTCPRSKGTDFEIQKSNPGYTSVDGSCWPSVTAPGMLKPWLTNGEPTNQHQEPAIVEATNTVSSHTHEGLESVIVGSCWPTIASTCGFHKPPTPPTHFSTFVVFGGQVVGLRATPEERLIDCIGKVSSTSTAAPSTVTKVISCGG
jgi:hypothetical protein